MLDIAVVTLTSLNFYLIFLLVILFLYLLSCISESFKKNIKILLKALIIIWVIFFGYRLITNNHLYNKVFEMFHEQKDTRYKKVKIDGQDVIYDTITNEVVNKKQKK